MMTRETFEAHVRAEAAARYERTPYNSASVKRNAYIAARMEHEWPLVEALEKSNVELQRAFENYEATPGCRMDMEDAGRVLSQNIAALSPYATKPKQP